MTMAMVKAVEIAMLMSGASLLTCHLRVIRVIRPVILRKKYVIP